MEIQQKLFQRIQSSKLPSFEKNSLIEALSLLEEEDIENVYTSVSQNEDVLIVMSKNLQSKMDYLLEENDLYSIAESDEKLSSLL